MRHNTILGNYKMSNQQMSTSDQQRDQGIPRSEVAKTNRKKLKNGQQTEQMSLLWFIAGNFKYKSKKPIDPPDLQIPSRSSSRICSAFPSQHLKRDINKIEKVQRRATKMIPEIRTIATTRESMQDLDSISLAHRSQTARTTN